MNLQWLSSGAVIIGAVASIFRSDNAGCPITLAPATRVVLCVVLGAGQATLENIVAGTPAWQAILTAGASVLAALAVHGREMTPSDVNAADKPLRFGQRGFGDRTLLLELLLFLTVITALPVVACKWLTPNHVVDVASIVECVLQDENDPGGPLAIAAKCGLEHEREVVDILTAHRSAVARELIQSVTHVDGGAK